MYAVLYSCNNFVKTAENVKILIQEYQKLSQKEESLTESDITKRYQKLLAARIPGGPITNRDIREHTEEKNAIWAEYTACVSKFSAMQKAYDEKEHRYQDEINSVIENLIKSTNDL